MQIGSLGDIIFEVSRLKVNTFNGLIKTAGGRWEVHQPIKSPVKPEFLGTAQGHIELSIQFNVQLGIEPREEIEKIEAMAENGLHAPFMLGNAPLSNNDWYIDQCETTFTHVGREGQIDVAEMQLSIMEYPI
jgi:hypothetical protein